MIKHIYMSEDDYFKNVIMNNGGHILFIDI